MSKCPHCKSDDPGIVFQVETSHSPRRLENCEVLTYSCGYCGSIIAVRENLAKDREDDFFALVKLIGALGQKIEDLDTRINEMRGEALLRH